MNRERAIQTTLLLLRLVVGAMFMQHGAAKLFGWFGGMPGGMKAPIMSEIGLAGILEFAGGIAILLGLATRVVGFVLSGEMAVAYFQVHAHMGMWPIENKGEVAVLYCFIFLYLAARGAGEYSLDAVFARRQPAHTAPTGLPGTA